MLLSALVVVVAASLVVANSSSEAQTPPPHAPTITVNARLVVLDVVVTDKDGRPVEGLTKNDFKIYDDNALQSIRSFEAPSLHHLPQASDDPATVFDPANPKPFGQSPVTVLVLDQLNTHFEDSSFARRQMHDFLAAEPPVLPQPATLLTVYQNHFKQLQGFTRNRDLLLKSLAAAPTEYAWQLEVNGKADHGPVERMDASLRALEEIAQNYARIPGRKNLVWVGGGFPTPDPEALETNDAAEIKSTLQHITDVLIDTRVTLYAVDPSSSAAGMTEVTDAAQMMFIQAAGDAAGGSVDPFNSAEDFDKLGPMTGGRVIRGMNDVAAQIIESVNLGSSFYTLGYSPTSDSNAEAKYRRLRVECLRPGTTVATRAGYYPEQTQRQNSAETMSYDLSTAAESTVALNGLSIRVEPNHSVTSEPEEFVVHVEAPSLTWTSNDDGTSTAHVAVMAVSLSSSGKMLAHTLHAMTATAKVGINVHEEGRVANFEFAVKPAEKATRLRFVVRDTATGRMGSVDLPTAKP